MRIVFMGTPEYGAASLQALLDAGFEVVAAFTQPDKPSGRGQKLAACPVKQLALSHGIPVYQPTKIRVDGVAPLRALAPDVCVTAAFGQILSQEILDIPRLGTVNAHASLLPKYRGSSPINWCLINGETVTGVTTMMTDKGMDTGDILLSEAVDILQGETAGELTERLAPIAGALLVKTLRRIEAGDCPRAQQDHAQASYYPLLKKEMGQIDWSAPTARIDGHIRGMTPWPGAYSGAFKLFAIQAERTDSAAAPGTMLEADAKRGLLVKTGDGAARVLELQAQGGKRMRATDYLRGHPMQAGGAIDG